MYVCIYLCLFMYRYVNIWSLIVILPVDLFLYFKEVSLCWHTGSITAQEIRPYGKVCCLSGSLDNLALENSRVVQENKEGDFLGLFCFL